MARNKKGYLKILYVLLNALTHHNIDVLLHNVMKVIPNFKKLSKCQQVEKILFGVNLNSSEYDCRNTEISFAIQKYILNTKRFCHDTTISQSSQPSQTPPSLPL